MFNLWNPTKKGTIILAGPRYGTHYLAKHVNQKVIDAGLIGTASIKEAELGQNSYHFLTAIEQLKQLEQREGYQIAILNTLQSKLMLIAYPNLADSWHIVRIVHNDKVQWFKSYWYFLVADNPKFDHHSTPIDVYEDYFKEFGPVELTDKIVWDAVSMLSTISVNQHIKCDEHVGYDDLPPMSNVSVMWKQNNYPNLSIGEMFNNSKEFAHLLENWPKEVQSGIR